ncbi:MAG: hypothetical protein E7435_02620 [Ruminococcaceae bacterium]|nr:hypothetical protein [Oscillospiraceae bacterium]
MKKSLLLLISILCVAVMLFGVLTGCQRDNREDPGDGKIDTLSLATRLVPPAICLMIPPVETPMVIPRLWTAKSMMMTIWACPSVNMQHKKTVVRRKFCNSLFLLRIFGDITENEGRKPKFMGNSNLAKEACKGMGFAI